MSDGRFHATVEGFSGSTVAGSTSATAVTWPGSGAQEQLGGVAVEGEVLLGDGEPDERHGVHLRDQLHGLQDADHREPVPADPHLGRVGQVVDAEQAGRLRAEHDRREVCGRRVQEGAVGDGGAEGGRQRGVGRAQ